MTKTATPPVVAAPEFMGRKVLSTYSGRPGCACGCRGKYTYHPATRDLVRRGYPVEDSEVSARGVAITIGKMQKIADSGIKLEFEGVEGGGYVAHETATRLYVIYFVAS